MIKTQLVEAAFNNLDVTVPAEALRQILNQSEFVNDTSLRLLIVNMALDAKVVNEKS